MAHGRLSPSAALGGTGALDQSPLQNAPTKLQSIIAGSAAKQHATSEVLEASGEFMSEDQTALAILDELYMRGKLTKGKCEKYKAHYSRLQSVVAKLRASENSTASKLMRTQNQVAAELRKIEQSETSSSKSTHVMHMLREQRTKVEHELARCRESEKNVEDMITDYRQQLESLKFDIEKIKKNESDVRGTRKVKLMEKIEALKDELQVEQVKHQRLARDKLEFQTRMKMLEDEIGELQEERIRLDKEYAEEQLVPDMIREQIARDDATFQLCREQREQLIYKKKDGDSEMIRLLKQKKDVQKKAMEYELETMNFKGQYEHKRGLLRNYDKKEEEAKEEHKGLAERAAKISSVVSHVNSELRIARDEYTFAQKEHNAKLREYKRAERTQIQILESLPVIRSQWEETQRHIEVLQKQAAAKKNQAYELEIAIKMQIAQALGQATIEKDQKDYLLGLDANIKLMKDTSCKLDATYKDYQKEMKDLKSECEMKARELSKVTQHCREAESNFQKWGIEIVQKKQVHELRQKQLIDMNRQYDIVKSERSQQSKQIQQIHQELAEIKDKVALIVQREEVLKKEAITYRAQLNEEVASKSKLLVECNNEVNKTIALKLEKEKKDGEKDKYIAKVDELETQFRKADNELQQLLKMYEIVVEERNYMGIQLIDRNDELCLLHEKVNAQDLILKSADLQLSRKEEKLYRIKLEERDLARQLENQLKQLPKIDEYHHQISEVRRQIEQEKVLVEELSEKLENPSYTERWKALPDKDADLQPEELKNRLKGQLDLLKKNLVEKNEVVLEKDLILKETVECFHRLEAESNETRPAKLENAQKLLDFKHRTEEINHRLKALISELSLYKSLSQQLMQQKEKMERDLEEARERLTRGECPTVEAMIEWNRYVEKVRRAAEGNDWKIDDKEEDEEANKPAPRPREYPDPEIGTAIPYGSQAPFKPSVSGAQMRHFRNPKPREIVL
eukprot:gnl/Hemi2/277_TR79_c0_g1_i1.p1 gnl/Hemi2/277_TR79_c0_g1~~gnl/Hemi2/277_TR79_c0_g1_i1.p1  ORF type:complete len:969 (+),score=413.13 gnl/Hemi2/277_TR79_c0_g1_i1:72-2978(+)